jgi:hypothetical protein
MKDVMLSGNAPKRNLIVEISASLLLLFYVHSIISLCSYYGFVSFENLLAFYTHNKTAVAISIIIIEGVISVFLFFRRTRIIGFIGALISITFAGIIIIYFPHKPHDFGGVFNIISYWQKWILIALLAILSILGIIKSYWVKNRNAASNVNQVVFT